MAELQRTREGYLQRADELLTVLDDELQGDLPVQDVRLVLYVLALAATAHVNIALAENMEASQDIQVADDEVLGTYIDGSGKSHEMRQCRRLKMHEDHFWSTPITHKNFWCEGVGEEDV